MIGDNQTYIIGLVSTQTDNFSQKNGMHFAPHSKESLSHQTYKI